MARAPSDPATFGDLQDDVVLVERNTGAIERNREAIDRNYKATNADTMYLAELIMQNTNRLDVIEEKLEAMDTRMENGFAELKSILVGIGKLLTRHDGMLHNHEGRLLTLEKA